MRMISEIDRQLDQQRKLLQQERTKQDLDAFYSQPQQEEKQAGRMTEREYDEFERKREQRFKQQILERIRAGYESVSAFDLQEAENLCMQDAAFKEAYIQARAEYNAKQLAKAQPKQMQQLQPVERKQRVKSPIVVQREAVSPLQNQREEEEEAPVRRYTPKPIVSQQMPQQPQQQVPQNYYPQMPLIIQQPSNSNYDSRFNEIDGKFTQIQQMMQQMQQFMQQNSRNEQQQMISELQQMRLAQTMQPQKDYQVEMLQQKIKELEERLDQSNNSQSVALNTQKISPEMTQQMSQMEKEMMQMKAEKEKLRNEILQSVSAQDRKIAPLDQREGSLTIGALQERNRLRWQMLQEMESKYE